MTSHNKLVNTLFTDILNIGTESSEIMSLQYAEQLANILEEHFIEDKLLHHCDGKGPKPFVDYGVDDYLNTNLAWRDSYRFLKSEQDIENNVVIDELTSLLGSFPNQLPHHSILTPVTFS